MNERDRRAARRLLEFLPLARRAETSEVGFAQAASYRDRESGIYYYRGVRYPEEFDRFREVLVAAGWLDLDYDQKEGLRYMDQPERVWGAPFRTVRRLLTFCDRGERFSDGFWGNAFEEGFVRRILERLAELSGKEVTGRK